MADDPADERVSAPRTDRRGEVGAVRRAVDLLGAFERQDAELPLSVMAQRAGLEPATAHRLVATLVDAGLLTQTRTRGSYRLGSRLLELGFAVLDQIEVRRIAMPYLIAFHAATHPRAASSLLVPDGRDMLNVERLPPRDWGLLVIPRLGHRFPMHAGAAGKVYLAALPWAEARAILTAEPLARLTARTETDVDRLEAELQEIRERGFGVSDQESVVGSRSIAAAVLDAHWRPVATLAAQAATSDLTIEAMVETIAQRLVGVAAQISATLGYEAGHEAGSATVRRVRRERR